jgi:UPF0755 protein
VNDDHLGLFSAADHTADRTGEHTRIQDPGTPDPRRRGFDEGVGRRPQDTGSVDLEALRAALRTTADKPQVQESPRTTRVAARERQAAARLAARKRTRRRRRSVLIALLVLVLISGGIVGGFLWWRTPATQEVRDFAGTGDTEVIVRVQSGDGLPTIAAKLADAGVVASAQAFVDGASNDADVAALKPGYYKVRQHSSAAAAADQIVDDVNHVGRARFVPGGQLQDVAAGSRTVKGYLSQIAERACVPLNGVSKCTTAAELEQAARTMPAAELGLPEWAIADVTRAPDPGKRLEGLLVPGDYDLPPNADAQTLLKSVFATSTAWWNSSNIITGAANQQLSPYRAVVIASLVEREGIVTDMQQVATVVDNRLDKGMKLQFDSTVNYALNRAQIATSDADRRNLSPYNTYAHTGLPPTPISSPGPDALSATYDPAPGTWLYFVKIDKSGKSCFSVTWAEHQACVKTARANGVFDG